MTVFFGLLILATVFADPYNLHDWECTTLLVEATVNEAITPFVCTYTSGMPSSHGPSNIRFNPQLPVGLSYETQYEYSGYYYYYTVTVSGSPAVAQQLKTYSIGYKEYVTQLRIGVYGTPTYLSYGFLNMTQYVGVPIEPVPLRSDVYIKQFMISPSLPSGVSMDPTTGTISGRFPDTSVSGQVYQVTGTNIKGSIQTTVSFIVKSDAEMTTNGYIGCYWSGTTECRTPAFDYYYQNSAQYCQLETKLDYNDAYGEGEGNTWAGLDERFRDYYTSYMYGYILAVTEGTYSFYLESDDASFLYIDSLDTPVINLDGCRSRSGQAGSTTLTVGRHLFVVKFLEIGGAAILSLKMSSPDSSTLTYLDNTMTKVGGRGPSFIEYPLITGYANAELKVYIPEMVSGGGNSWTVEPALPTGISLDPSSGHIRGKPVSSCNSKHTVTAVGFNGAASVEISVIVTDSNHLSGFYGQYYKVLDTEMCVYTSFAPSQISLTVIRVDPEINFPLSSSGVWDGLTMDMMNYFYVEWEGYLYHDEIGTWKMRLSCDDGCRLFGVEETLLIDNWGKCHSWASVEGSVAVSNVGYFYYRVRYMQEKETKGMQLIWQGPTGGWEEIPTDKIFHVAPSMLSYTYEHSHYYKGVEITPNTPLLFFASSCSSYSILPALPTGMGIDFSSGIISGTPSAEQILKQYTVTCTSPNAGQISTVISFDVFYELPPSGLYLTQGGSQISGTVYGYPGATFTNIVVQGDTDAITYSITPTLPFGLSLNAMSGVISGIPLEPVTDVTYVLTATSAGGMMTMTFKLTIYGCKGTDGGSWSNELYLFYAVSGSGSISVKSGGSVTQCSMGSHDSSGNAELVECRASLTNNKYYAICMKPDPNAQVEISCTSDVGCYSQMMRPDGNRWPSRFTYNEGSTPYVDVFDFPSSLTPLTLVTLSKTETTIYTGMPIDTIDITLNGCYKEIKIEPSIGMDNEIDLYRPVISGYINGLFKTVYTITASGDAGEASTELTVYFLECGEDGNSNLIRVEFILTFYANEQYYEIYNPSGSMILSQGPNLSSFTTYQQSICTTPGDYTIVLGDTYGDGWSSGSYVKIYDNNDQLIQEFTITGWYKSYKSYFTIAKGTASNSVWKILLDGRPNNNWKNIDFDSSSWETTEGRMEFGNWGQTTIYLRYEDIDLEDASRYPLVQFGLWYKDGVIVYLNGEEVYRRNMNPGSVSHNTAASSQYDGYYMRIGSAPGHVLVSGKNVVAVEIHKYPSSSGVIQFRGYANALQGNCISRIDDGTITESVFFNQPTESAAAAWDRNPSTKWIENGLNAWTIYSYNFDRMEWVNKLALTSSNDGHRERDPASFVLSGSTDGVTWDILYSYRNLNMFTSSSETKEFMMMNHLNAYSKYKLEISETSSGGRKVSLSVIDLQSCQLNYCVKDGAFDGVASDVTSIAPCPSGYIGEMYRLCSLVDLKPTWGEIDDTECLTTNPPKETVFVDVAYRFSNFTVASIQDMDINNRLVMTLANVVGVQTSQVSLWKVKDVSSEYIESLLAETAFWVRFTAPEESSTELVRAVSNSLTQLDNQLKTFHQDIFKYITIYFYMNPVLQKRSISGVSIALIVILVILVLIIAAIAGFYIWVRTKSKKQKNGAKQLRSGQGKVNAQHLAGKKDVRI